MWPTLNERARLMNGFLRTALKAALGLTAAITIVASTAAPASAANPTNYCNYDYCRNLAPLAVR